MMVSNLKTSVRWTTTSSIFRSVLALGQIILLSRILEPEVFGIQALAMGVINMLIIFTDFGLSNAIIHDQDIKREELSALFWINIYIGFILSLLLFLLSGKISDFFHSDRVGLIIQAISFSFLIISVGQQGKALSEKKLDFKGLAIIEIISSIIGLVAAASFALSRYAIYALTVGYLSSIATSSIGYLLNNGLKDLGRPTLKVKEVKHLMSFGGKAVIVSILNAIAAQIDTLIMGRFFPVAVVAFYNQPRELTFKVVSTINPIITRITLPLIANQQSDRLVVADIYNKTVAFTAAINFPIFIFSFVFSEEICSIFFGIQWSNSAVYLRAVSIWCLFRCVGNPIGSLLIGTGRINNAIFSALSVSIFVLVATLSAASTRTAVNIPYYLAGLYFLLIPGFWAFNVYPACGISFREYHDPLARALFCGIIGGAFAYYIGRFLDISAISFFIIGLCYMAIYALLSFTFNKRTFSLIIRGFK